MASWTIGFQAANLGGKLDGQKLPARLGLGGAVDLPFSMENRLQVALDLNYLLPSEYRHLQAGIGAEYNFLKYGVVRAGYHFGDNDKGTGNYGTLGCGINFWPIRADFSYALYVATQCWNSVLSSFKQFPKLAFKALLHFVHRHFVLQLLTKGSDAFIYKSTGMNIAEIA